MNKRSLYQQPFCREYLSMQDTISESGIEKSVLRPSVEIQQSRRARVVIAFAVLLLLLLTTLPSWGQELQPAEEYGYGFDNPGGSLTYSWDVFRNAFYGVPIDSSTSWFTAPFDMILYNEAVRSKMANPDGDTINGSGRCFGWSTSAAMMAKYGGYRGFCGPPIQYVGADPVTGNPTEPGLTRVIEITQIQQLTLACIQSIIDQTIGGHSQGADYPYALLKEAIERDGVAVLGVTKTLDPLSGAAHAVVAYELVDSTASIKKVMVVDPNRSWGIDTWDDRGWYERGENFLILDLTGNEWKFKMAGGDFFWPNDGADQFDSAQDADITSGATDSATIVNAHPIGTGHLIVYPLSIAGVPGRTPTSLGLGVTQLLAAFWIYNEEGSGGRLLQVTDNENHRLFVSEGEPQIDHDRSTGLCTMAPWFPMVSRTSADPLNFQLWFNRGPLGSGQMRVASGDGMLLATTGGNHGFVRVRIHEPNVEGTIAFTSIGSVAPSISIHDLSANGTIDIELLVPIEPGRTHRVWKLEGVQLRKGEDEIRLAVDMYGGAHVSGRHQSSGQLTYEQRSLLEKHNFAAERVVIPRGEEVNIAPDEWKEYRPTSGSAR